MHGIKGIFTAHGANINELYLHKSLRQLLDTYMLEKIIFLNPLGKRGEIEKIYSMENEKYTLEKGR